VCDVWNIRNAWTFKKKAWETKNDPALKQRKREKRKAGKAQNTNFRKRPDCENQKKIMKNRLNVKIDVSYYFQKLV